MKLRKTIISLLATLLLISSLQITAFAEEDHYYNLYADFLPYNEACVELDSLKDVKDAKLVITKNDDPSITVTLPLEYDADPEWMDLWGSDYQDTPEMRAILADLTEKTKGKTSALRAKKAAKAAIKNNQDQFGQTLRTKKSTMMFSGDILAGYTLTVEGVSEHFSFKNYYAFLSTAETVQAEIDETIAMIRYYGGNEYKDYEMPETYGQLMDDLAKVVFEYDNYAAFLKDGDYTDEEIEAVLADLKEMDMVLADIANGVYYGQLDIYGDMECDCPESLYAWIDHEYYKTIDGKRTLIMTKSEEITALEGTTLYAKDYAKPELNGDTYTLTEILTYPDRKPADEITMKDDFTSPNGFVLCYDYAGDDAGAAAGDSTDADDDKVNRKPEVVTGENGPDTGDYTPIGTYLFVIGLAAAAMCAMLGYKKRS